MPVLGFHFQVTLEVPEKSMRTRETGLPPGGVAAEYVNSGWGGVVMVGCVP